MNSTPQQTLPKPLRRRQPFPCLPETTPNELPLAPEHMPSVYHLHPTESQADFGLTTPPASPGRRFVSPHTKLTEADMAGTTCSCGHSMFDGKGCCPACDGRQRKRHQRLSNQAASSGQAPWTPPPSNPSSPRESLDRGRSIPVPHGARNSSAADSFTSAFASEEEQPSIFPTSFNRTPRRASPRGSMSAVGLPVRTRTISHSQDHVGPVLAQLAKPVTPDAGNGGTAVREYSPMAAGFARLNRKETPSPHANVNRAMRGERTSLDISARMFAGPA